MNTLLYAIVLLTVIQLSFQAKLTDPVASSDRSYILRVTRLTCIDTPYKLTDLKVCKVKLLRNEPTRIFIEFDMSNTSVDELYTWFTVNYKINGRYQPLLLDLYYELCSASNAKPGTNVAADYFLNAVRAHVPQAIHPCPYGNRYYNWSDFTVDEKFMPKTIPAGDYRVDLRLADKHNVTILSNQCFIAVRSKGLTQLSLMDW